MKFSFNNDDMKLLNKLIETKNTNMDVASFYCDLLFEHPFDYTSSTDLRTIPEQIISTYDVPKEISQRYKINQIEVLDSNLYKNNPYLTNIKFNKTIKDNCELGSNYYEPGEIIVYDDICVDESDFFCEKTNIAYFTDTFYYPQVLQNNQVWMSITPHEINTMKDVIKKASGNVLVLGLGLGYFPYCCSLKEEVKSIVIIEKDKAIIDLFTNYILPQFPYKDKITIVKADGIRYLYKDLSEKKYDYCFADLWHDANDGIETYYQLLKKEKNHPNITFSYWLEHSLITLIRRCLITLLDEEMNNQKINYANASNSVDKMINKMHYYLKQKVFNSYKEIDDLLSPLSIKTMLKEI